MAYKLKYLDEHPQEPQGALIGGQAVHAVVETLEKSGAALDTALFSEEGAIEHLFGAAFDPMVEAEGGEASVRWGGRPSKLNPRGEDAEWWRTYGPGMVRGWHRVRLNDEHLAWSLVPEFVEVEVSAILPSGAPFICYIDAVMETPEGFVIRDYKTGKPWETHRTQLALYAWACRQTLGLPVVGGEDVYLKSPTLERARFDTEPLEAPMLDWLGVVGRGVSEGIFMMNPTFMCKTCSVREGCPYGRTLEGEEA